MLHDVEDEIGVRSLFRAARANDVAAVKSLLDSAAVRYGQLNVADPINGWTPLCVACIYGQLEIVILLLKAGAKQRIYDLAGWTEKEHACFRGHMQVARYLALHETGDTTAHGNSDLLRTGMPHPAQNSVDASSGKARISNDLAPRVVCSNGCRVQSDSSQIFLTLGPGSTRSNRKVVELSESVLVREAAEGKLGVTVRPGGTQSSSSYSVDLPLVAHTNMPLHLRTDRPDSVTLTFEVTIQRRTHTENASIIGTGMAVLSSMRRELGPKRESLIRNYTVPLFGHSSMAYIGSLTFSILLVLPFKPPQSLPKPSAGFWREQGPTQVVGHRGSGANSTTRSTLQIGENTVQSFLSAIALGASCVEFDVQLTRDSVPIIFHDFLVMETGSEVPLHTLTYSQFIHLSRSQAPRNDLLSAAEARFLDRSKDTTSSPKKPRSRSLNTYDDYRSQDLLQRMRLTEEGMHGNIKGNLWGLSIQEPSTTLEELLTKLPERLAFNLEIKYPMLWEAEDRGMDLYALELNFFVDTILTMVFRLCKDRNITLSSFSPEICIMLACKQKTFPILFINKAGSVPTGDVRAGSLQGAIEFAKAWELTGIVMLSDPFVMCPRLLKYAKDSGLIVGSYGDWNDEPEYALIQAEAGLHAIMTNKIRLISETLAKARP